MANDNESAFSVSESLTETCESLLKHSFAIHRVNKDAANDISKAWTLAQDFFASSAQQKSSCHQIINGNLHGFHTPSDAKELFRAFCGSTQQPWPNDDFQTASEHVAEKLHSLLLKCHDELMRKSLHNTDEVPSSAKRLKQTTPLDIPSSALETVDCPLDYFFYHGDKPNAVSCSEHLDRGILICVCLTFVHGLEVLPRGNEEREFWCPEEICTHQTGEKQKASSGLVCIMAGDQLKQIHPDAKACIHRVRNDLEQSRLSISYELRGAESKGVGHS